MKHKLLTFSVFLILISSLSFGNCPNIFFGQPTTDWYRGLSIPTVEVYYLTQGNIRSLVHACHPKSDYIYEWENGFYIFGVYAGTYKGQCKWVTCPDPQKNPNERMIIVMAEASKFGTKFIIDSVKWDPFFYGSSLIPSFGFFNFDRSNGTVHDAGILAAPKVKASNAIVRGTYNVNLQIPIPRSGYYSDSGITPSSLIAGIAIFGKEAQSYPFDLDVSEFQLLKVVPVDKNDLQSFTVETNLSLQTFNPEKYYLAYTLIINDGTDLPLGGKLTLPFTSPAVPAFVSPIIMGMEAEKVIMSNEDDLIVASSTKNPLNSIKAIKDGYEVSLEFAVSNPENKKVEIYKSYDLENWEKIFDETLRGKENFKFKDYLDFEPELGVFYEIKLINSETGEEIYKAKTRAREF